jgi:hypothetical protein
MMSKEKWSHDRNIKRFAYRVGDYVLYDHPKLQKGMSRGISHKYYGPFIIKRIDVNNVDYIIQRANTKKGKLYKVHKNRLKFYHMSSNKLKQTELISDSTIENDHGIVKSKRKYTKNINNPRWKNQKNLNRKNDSDLVTSSSRDYESITTNNTIDERISNSETSKTS